MKSQEVTNNDPILLYPVPTIFQFKEFVGCITIVAHSLSTLHYHQQFPFTASHPSLINFLFQAPLMEIDPSNEKLLY
jgi:hypothetical protein